MKKFLIYTTAFLALSLFAQNPSYQASYSENAPVLDGKMDDAVWNKAKWSSSFRTRVKNTQPAAPTLFKAIYTSDALYIGAKCTENEMEKMKKENNYTEFWLYDVIEIFLLPFHNEMQHFICSVSGSMNEEIPVQTSARTKRQTAWAAKAYKGKKEWYIEFCIPLYMVGKAPTGAESISFPVNVCRNSTPAEELSSWSFQKGSFKVKSGFGTLTLLPAPAGERKKIAENLKRPHSISLVKRWKEIKEDPAWQYLLSQEKETVKKLNSLCGTYESVRKNASTIFETLSALEKKRAESVKAHKKAVMKMLFND